MIITVVLIVYGEARHAKKKKKKTTVQSKYSKLRTIYIESKEAGEISYIYYFSIVLQWYYHKLSRLKHTFIISQILLVRSQGMA